MTHDYGNHVGVRYLTNYLKVNNKFGMQSNRINSLFFCRYITFRSHVCIMEEHFLS